MPGQRQRGVGNAQAQVARRGPGRRSGRDRGARGERLGYTFDFGDGTVSNGTSAEAAHSYAWTGTPTAHTVTVTVTDTSGKTATTSKTVNVTAPVGPTAKVDAAATAPVNTPVPISGATTAEGSSAISTYSFDFGDGSPRATGNTAAVQHTYTATGAHTISLTTTDGSSLASTATTTITIGSPLAVGYVARVASDATAVPSGTGRSSTITVHPAHDTLPGDSLIISMMVSSTTYGNVTATDTAGDTFTTVSDVNDGGGAGGGDRELILAAYKTRGLNLADSVTVTYGKSAEDHVAIDEYSGIKAADTATGSPGTASIGFNSGAITTTRPGELIVAAAGIQKSTTAAFTSPGLATLPLLQVATGQAPDDLATGWQIAASAAGAYSSTGNSAGTSMASVAAFTPDVLTSALTVAPSAGLAPLASTLDAGRSTPGLYPITQYAFTFGDGTTAPAPGTATTAAHTYANPGTYTAKATVTDASGATDTTTVTVTVTSAQKPLTHNGQIATDANATTGSTTVALSPVTNTTTGDTLILPMLLNNSDAYTAGSIGATDTKGNAYTLQFVHADSGGDYLAALTAVNITALTTSDVITITWPSNNEHLVTVEDFSGVTAIDQTSVADSGTNATTFNSGPTGTTAASTELLYGFAGVQGGTDATWDQGWTANPIIFPGNSDQLLTATRPVAATGSYAASGTTAAVSMAGILTLR